MGQNRWVCLDIGETLVDETRVWETWAAALAIPRFTLMATLGSCIARGGDHGEAFELLGTPDWQEHEDDVAAAYGGFQPDDLYPDALRSLEALRGEGYKLAVVGNQPARRRAELRAIGVRADVVAMSEELGVEKPDPAFFDRLGELTGSPPPELAYVGDRIDNDVVPAAAAGMRAVWLRRGPWAALQRDTGGDATLTVSSLDELAERIGETFPSPQR